MPVSIFFQSLLFNHSIKELIVSAGVSRMCSRAGATCCVWDLSPRGPYERGPFPRPTGEGICTYLILIALTPEDPISLETRAQIVACWVTMPTYILHMPHLADTPKIPTTLGVLKMKNVKTSDSVKHVSQRGSGWIPVVWRIGSLEGGKLLRKDVNDRLSSEKTLSLHYLTLDLSVSE